MVFKKKEERRSRMEIDLTGPQGNAFCLLGIAKNLCRQLDREWDFISKEMQSGDYENLLAVFEREFGSFVTMYR